VKDPEYIRINTKADAVTQTIWDTLDDEFVGQVSVGELKSRVQSCMPKLGLKKGQLVGCVMKTLGRYGFMDNTKLDMKDFVSLMTVS